MFNYVKGLLSMNGTDLDDKRLAYDVRHRNPNNTWITEEHMQKIFHKFKIDCPINDINHYRQAFIHFTYLLPSDEDLEREDLLNESEKEELLDNYEQWIPLQKKSYDRYEFLGDRVLDLAIADYIYHRYPEEGEGFMTKLKTKLVRAVNLSILAKKLKLEQFVIVSKHFDHYRNKISVLEDVFEAFLGAIYQDLGCEGQAYLVCKTLVLGVMERYLNFSQIVRRNDNYKDLLLQYYHKHFKKANGMGMDPEYVEISRDGPVSTRVYRCGVLNVDGHVIAHGEGRKVVNAEQLAAKQALKYYGEEVYSDTEEKDKEVYSDSESESL